MTTSCCLKFRMFYSHQARLCFELELKYGISVALQVNVMIDNARCQSCFPCFVCGFRSGLDKLRTNATLFNHFVRYDVSLEDVYYLMLLSPTDWIPGTQQAMKVARL